MHLHAECLKTEIKHEEGYANYMPFLPASRLVESAVLYLSLLVEIEYAP